MKKKILIILCLLLHIIMTNAHDFCLEYHSNRMATTDDVLYIAASKGIVKFDKRTRIVSNASDELCVDKESVISLIKISPEGNIFYADNQFGVYKYDGTSTIKLTSQIITFPYQVYSMAIDKSSNFWLSSICFYSEFLSEGTEINKYLIPDGYVVSNYGIIVDMDFDTKGNLWIGARGFDSHILCHKVGSNKSETVLKDKREICSLSIDNKDNIWFSDENGIHCYNQEQNKDSIMTNATNPNIPATQFYANDTDSNGNVWFTSSHYLLRYDGENFKWWNCYGYHEARAILCDGDIVWVLLKSDKLLKFQNNEFETIDLSPAVTGIEDRTAEESNSKAYVSNGVLYVRSSEEITNISIYDSMGRTLFSPNPSAVERGEIAIPLDFGFKGILLVKVNSEIIKVVI